MHAVLYTGDQGTIQVLLERNRLQGCGLDGHQIRRLMLIFLHGPKYLILGSICCFGKLQSRRVV